MGTQKNHLNEMVRLCTQNICLDKKIRYVYVMGKKIWYQHMMYVTLNPCPVEALF